MDKSQPDGSQPLPETAELGGEGGSFGDSAARESRRSSGHVARVKDQTVTDLAGNVMRLPEVKPDGEPADE